MGDYPVNRGVYRRIDFSNVGAFRRLRGIIEVAIVYLACVGAQQRIFGPEKLGCLKMFPPNRTLITILNMLLGQEYRYLLSLWKVLRGHKNKPQINSLN